MSDPVLTGISAGVTAISGIASAFGGGDTTESYLELPPVLEFAYLDGLSFDLNTIYDSMQRIDMGVQQYNQKIDLLDQGLAAGMMSNEQTKMLTQINFNIGKSMGMSAQQMMEGGLLTDYEKQGMQQLFDLADPNKMSDNPMVNQQLMQQRAQLEQDLAMRGTSASVRAQALAQFDQQAALTKFQASQEMKTSQSALLSGALGTGQALRQGNLGMAQQQMEGIGSLLDRQSANIELREKLANNKFGATTAGAAAQVGLVGARHGMFAGLGEFKFSSGASRGLESGHIGSGAPYRRPGELGQTAPGFGGNPQQQGFGSNPLPGQQGVATAKGGTSGGGYFDAYQQAYAGAYGDFERKGNQMMADYGNPKDIQKLRNAQSALRDEIYASNLSKKEKKALLAQYRIPIA
jgi:hypothetical protein